MHDSDYFTLFFGFIIMHLTVHEKRDFFSSLASFAFCVQSFQLNHKFVLFCVCIIIFPCNLRQCVNRFCILKGSFTQYSYRSLQNNTAMKEYGLHLARDNRILRTIFLVLLFESSASGAQNLKLSPSVHNGKTYRVVKNSDFH